jgi:ABC-2 type transport system permease protein
MRAIFRKELADYFGSFRFLVLLVLVLLITAATLYFDYKSIRTSTADTEFIFLRLFTTQPEGAPQTEGINLFSFINFFALFFIPIMGIALGFDAISGERSSGNLSRLLSQPIYRDNVIIAKFLAGLFALSLMVITSVLIISGYGLQLIGVPPSLEEIYRLVLFVVLAIFYGAFWMGLAVLFSTVFKRVSTSLMSSLGIWLFFGLFYVLLIAPAIANSLAPTASGTLEAVVHNLELGLSIKRFSPNFLFLEASGVLLQPPPVGSLLGAVPVVTSDLINWMIPAPLSLGQTLLLVWPHLTSLLSLTIVCFAVGYVVFMRQEIRAT